MSGRVFLCFDCFEDFFLANSEGVPCPYCESSNIREYSAPEVLDLWRKAAEAEEVRYTTVVSSLVDSWWKKEFLENDGLDLGERNQIRREQDKKFNEQDYKLVKELNKIYPYHKDYLTLKQLFRDKGYEVEELREKVKVKKVLE